MDEIARLEEQIAENLGSVVQLNPNEIPALKELIHAADGIDRETKIERILEVVDDSFSERAVLFFTEYKATQALVMSALQCRFGDGCVAFINGDGFVEGVCDSHGDVSTHTQDRRFAAKLDRITLAFQGAMDDPEDMRQLVIGMASPRMFTNIFADADPEIREQRLEQWFNVRTATFGGADAVGTVRNLIGNVARFDFGEVADQIPRVDLPDLAPFFKSLFAMLGKRPQQVDDLRLTFKTPQEWMDDFTISEYDLLFARDQRVRDGEDV